MYEIYILDHDRATDRTTVHRRPVAEVARTQAPARTLLSGKTRLAIDRLRFELALRRGLWL